MRKKTSKTPLYFLLFSVPAVVIILLLSLELRDRKIDEVSSRIRNLEELVTARQIYRNVIYTEVKESLIVDKRALFTINYVVTAGVDLSSGFSIRTFENEIIVSYPYPRILNIDADEVSIDEYFALERFGRLKQSDYMNIIFDEKTRIKEDALQSELLIRADRNLQNLISGLLREAGIESIRFESERPGGDNEA